MAGGSAGPGKSLILLADPFEQIYVEHERCRRGEIKWGQSVGWALHLRRQFPTLEQTIARSQRIFPSIDPKAKYDPQKHMWLFSSGYKFQFGHCKNDDDWSLYRSGEYTHIGYDELTEFTREQYDQISTRCRTTDPVLSGMLKIRAATNPGIGWVRDYFIDPAPEGRKVLVRLIDVDDGAPQKVTRLFLPATLDDNPDKAFVRQYKLRLASKPDHIKKALLYGDWYVVPGAFFAEEWVPRLHVIKAFRIPSGWTRYRSMDWGYKTNGVVLWWAVDPDDNLIVERELTFRYLTAHQVALRIREIEIEAGLWDENRERSRITGPADTQLWEERGESAVSKAEEMSIAGVNWTKANKSSRSANAQRVIARLKDYDDANPTPGLMFFEAAKMCRKTIPSLATDPNNPEEPLKCDSDHWYDAVSYGVAHRARSAPITSEYRRKKDDDFDDDRDKASSRSGRHGYGGH